MTQPAKTVYTLMLALVIVLSGCFGLGSDDTEAEDDSDSDDSGGSTTDTTDSQDRTWFTSGGTYDTDWNDDFITKWSTYYMSENYEFCADERDVYDSSNGSYIRTDCYDWEQYDEISEWDLSECTDLGGVPVWTTQQLSNNGTHYTAYLAPTCIITHTTIETSSGEALLIYETTNVNIVTTCDGVEVSTVSNHGQFGVAAGSAMDCSHALTKTIDYGDGDDLAIWSIVYAIQDVTVV